MDPRPLFLIGFMATGKTTVGRLLAARLGRGFVDLDLEVERAAGRSVAEIFKEEGERGFRRREAAALAAAVAGRDTVVALGGGAPAFADNLARLRSAGLLVALRASFTEILRRAGDVGGRPLLDEAGGALYAEREALYASADLVVDTDGRTAEEVADGLARQIAAQVGDIAVLLGARGYPVHLRPLTDLGALARELVPRAGTALIVTDENVARAGHPAAAAASFRGAGFDIAEVVLAPGEGSKRLGEVERVALAAVEAGLDRFGVVVAVGGGVVGDIAGLVAALLHRGVPHVQVPTSLVAMADAAVGGKTAVDLSLGRNLLGVFHQPRLVLVDRATLETLPPAELRAGWGEVLKAALVGDPTLFAAILEHGGAVDVGEAILAALRLKARLVAADERDESGARAALNLGHTLAHAVEAAAGPRVRHGEAVALGLVAAARISLRLGLCDSDLPMDVERAVSALGLDGDLRPWIHDDVLAHLPRDKKRAGARLRFVALEAVGKTRLVELPLVELGELLRAARA